jgi:magnesium transporter
VNQVEAVMNQINNKNDHPEQIYFLSEIIGARAIFRGKRIGHLSDLIIAENGKLPVAKTLYISRPFGNPSLLVPIEKADFTSPRQVELLIEALEPYQGEPAADAVLLKDHVLDKKVLDLEDREVEVVYDVLLSWRDHKMHVTGVDLSRYGLLRRIGLKKLADFIYNLAERIREQTISWNYIQPLPTKLDRFRGNLKLKVLKEKLADIHPSDLADILEELDHDQRFALFNELDLEQASETLEEIEPKVQRALIASLDKDKVAELLNEMTPGQAADVLSILPWWEVKVIWRHPKLEHAEKIKAIFQQQDDKIVNYATEECLKFGPDLTAHQVVEQYHVAAKGKDAIMYVYVVDGSDKLLGVIDIKELLLAEPEERLQDIMTEEVIALKTEDTMKKALNMFKRYGFRALPLTDETDKMLGVIPYRDVMNLTHAI